MEPRALAMPAEGSPSEIHPQPHLRSHKQRNFSSQSETEVVEEDTGEMRPEKTCREWRPPHPRPQAGCIEMAGAFRGQGEEREEMQADAAGGPRHTSSELLLGRRQTYPDRTGLRYCPFNGNARVWAGQDWGL